MLEPGRRPVADLLLFFVIVYCRLRLIDRSLLFVRAQNCYGADAYGGAYWRHLANTVEPSVCGGDAALCQITVITCYYRRQRGYVIVVVCLSVCLLATLRKSFRTDLHEIFREGWQWANKPMIKFWWRSRSRIRIAKLLRCALAEVRTVPVLLVIIAIVINIIFTIERCNPWPHVANRHIYDRYRQRQSKLFSL